MPPKSFGQFVAGIFSEPDGTPSASRLISLLSTLVWLTIVLVDFFRRGAIPSAGELAAGGLGANAAYLANRLSQLGKGK